MRPAGAAVLIASLFLAACGKEAPPADPVRPVLVQQVMPVAHARRNVFSGEVKARHEADLGFRVGGKIAARLVDVGAEVKPGQVLARLDPADARLAADAARAQLAAARTEHGFAKAEYERYRSLLEQKFISQAVFDQRESAYKAAAARLEQARAQAAVAGNQADYTALVADRAGIITQVSGEPGQVVAAGQPVLRLARPEEREVMIHVPESRMAELRGVEEVALALWSDPNRRYQGRIREVAPSADPMTRTFTVKVSIVDPGPEVRLGMTANVLLGAEGMQELYVVPLSAVAKQGDGAVVWVLDGERRTVAPRSVKVGQYTEQGATVQSGLKAGEWVVTAGVHKLRSGQPVRPVERSVRADAS